ncbi:hypothetical protein [Bifidobacterium samirii]|uniref:Uncharacterized protein n=1 Tax=Bifidobacterium samirii TaxID=2306974 RepID=A0A430FJM1_9BIFI|nr:hypothetical protein [Bifidobacterium samirii]RSX52982.1 hypothetical protein D2E24_1653 [Bifidobacterium samirii]
MSRNRRKRSDPEGKKHPEGGMELLIHFHESVLQYDLYTQEVLKTTSEMMNPESDDNFIKYCLRAALLRKYWAPEDELALDKVIATIKSRLDNSTDSSHERLQSLEHLLKSFTCAYRIKNTDSNSNSRSESAKDKAKAAYRSVTPHQAAVDYVYGMLLHGDYQKWLNARNPNFLSLLSIGNEVARLEKFVHSVHDFLNEMVNDGTLTPDFSRILQDSPTKGVTIRLEAF